MEPREPGPYRIDRDGPEIVIRARSDLISSEEIINILDLVLLQKWSEDLSLSDAEIETLAKEAKHSMWQRLRPMVEKKLARRMGDEDHLSNPETPAFVNSSTEDPHTESTE
jgi:hypothetical protein